MHPSNFEFKLVSVGREDFDAGVEICFRSWRTAKSWAEKDGWLELNWHEDVPGAHPLPYEMNVEAVKGFVWGWLESQAKPSTKLDDFDGSSGSNAYDMEGADYGYRIMRVRKEWAEYHK